MDRGWVPRGPHDLRADTALVRGVALENTHLAPKHDDVGVLVGLASTGGPDEAENTAQAEIEEGEGHSG